MEKFSFTSAMVNGKSVLLTAKSGGSVAVYEDIDDMMKPEKIRRSPGFPAPAPVAPSAGTYEDIDDWMRPETNLEAAVERWFMAE